MLELLYTSPRKIAETWENALYLRQFVFNKLWDAMIFSGGLTGANHADGTYKVFKDGHALRCMDSSNPFPMLEMDEGRLCTFTSTGSNPYTYNLYELDSYTATPMVSPFVTFTSNLLLQRGWLIDRKRALILRAGSDYVNNYLRIYSLTNGTALLQTLYTTDRFYSVHWMSDGNAMLATNATNDPGTWTTPKITLVDYLTLSVLLRSQINPYRIAVFDSHCGVVFAINTSGYTEIYYPQAVPSHLTVPVLDPAVVSLYGGSLVSAQVLGDLDEPCPDRVVHWYLENGIGALNKEATKSGADGTASNYYFAPDDPTKVGMEETIRAETII